jgi:hypothetical protein
MRVYKNDTIKFMSENCEDSDTIKEHKERLQAACNEAYQVIGLMLLEGHEHPRYTDKDVRRMLDNLLAAVNNRPLPHSDLLPWPKPQS